MVHGSLLLTAHVAAAAASACVLLIPSVMGTTPAHPRSATPTHIRSRSSPSHLHRRLQEEASILDKLEDSISGLFFDDYCERTEKDVSNLSDHSDWMSILLGPDTNLGDITFPGTHHSAAYTLTKSFNPNDPEYASTIESASISLGVDIPDKLVSPWACDFALTQSLSISEQLQAGVRYLDLRVDYDSQTQSFRVFHLLFGQQIDIILRQIKEFIDVHPKEVIVVEMSELFNPNVDFSIKGKLLGIILDTFGSSLFPSGDALPTFGEMQTAGTSIIFAVQDDDINSASDLIWPTSGIIRNTFANSADLATMQNYNQERIEEFEMMEDGFLLRKLSWILTPDEGYIESNFFSGSLYSLAKDEANPQLRQFAASNQGKQMGNILLVDYVETSPMLDILGISSSRNGDFVPEKSVDSGDKSNLVIIILASSALVALAVIVMCCRCCCCKRSAATLDKP